MLFVFGYVVECYFLYMHRHYILEDRVTNANTQIIHKQTKQIAASGEHVHSTCHGMSVTALLQLCELVIFIVLKDLLECHTHDW